VSSGSKIELRCHRLNMNSPWKFHQIRPQLFYFVTVPKQTNEQMINKQNYRVIVQLYWGLFESPSIDGILTPTPTNSGGCHTCLLSKFSRTIGISILHIWKLLSCGPLWVQMGCNIRIYSLALMSYLVKFCGSAFNDFWVGTGNMICFKRVSGALSLVWGRCQPLKFINWSW